MLALLLLSTVVSAAPPAPKPVSVLGYNVLFDSTRDSDSITAIKKADADVVCLTELTDRFSKTFESDLAKTYPYRSFKPATGTWGVGIASKFPLKAPRSFEQKPHKMPAIEATAKTPSGDVLISCLHLFPPGAKRKKSQGYFEAMSENATLREQQAKELVKRYKAAATPVVLVGDLNEGPDGAAVSALTAGGYSRACSVKESRCGATWPGATSSLPAVVQIDHILGAHVRFESARVIREGGSDHFPVFATFRPE